MKTIKEFVDALKMALGNNLTSAVEYGSTVTDETSEKYSRVNLFLLVQDDSPDAFKNALPIIQKWTKAGHPSPHFFTASRFDRAKDVFPIEFADIAAHHRVLLGSDPFAGIKINPAHFRHQLEFELRSKLIQLRERHIAAGAAPAPTRELMAHSLSSFGVLCKSVLRFVGEPAPERKSDAWKVLQRFAPVDVSSIEKIWDIRQGGKLPDAEVNAVFAAYVKSIEAVIDFVDQK